MSEGSDVEEYALPLTSEGVVRLVPRLRERYLTEHVDEAVVQACGDYLTIRIWSDRENVLIKLPFDGYRAERLYTRSVNSWGVNVNRWTTPGRNLDGSNPNWWDDAQIEVVYGGASNKEMVQATVETFEGVKPHP